MTRILLVEDEGAIAQTIEFALRAEGFETTHALTGRDALACAATVTCSPSTAIRKSSEPMPQNGLGTLSWTMGWVWLMPGTPGYWMACAA